MAFQSSYECLLSFLVIFKVCKRVRSSDGFFGSWAGLQDILIRDSVLYYVGYVPSFHILKEYIIQITWDRICLVFATNLVIWFKSSVGLLYYTHAPSISGLMNLFL